MNFTDLTNEVYTITNRPDLVNETATALKSATLESHLTDYYYPDLVESSIDMGSTAMTWTFDYTLISAKWRAIKYLRKYDPVTNTPGDMLDLVVPENVLDDYQTNKQDIFYVAGKNIVLNSSTSDRYYLIGYYNLPDINIATYSSFIAAYVPYAIVYNAVSKVFKAIGKDEEAAVYKTMVPDQLALIRATYLVPNGF